MPVLLKKDINNSFVWVSQVIDNEELFDFLPTIDKEELLQRGYKKEMHRKQFISSRVLIKGIIEGELGEKYDGLNCDKGVPQSLNNKVVSISHSESVVAVGVSIGRFGLDIQRVTSKVSRVIERLCCENELILAGGDLKNTVLWSVKEAIYKFLKKPGIDFRSQIEVQRLEIEKGKIRGFGRVFVSSKEEEIKFEGELIEDYVLVYTV